MASRMAEMRDALTAVNLVVMKVHYWVGTKGSVMASCLVAMRVVSSALTRVDC